MTTRQQKIDTINNTIVKPEIEWYSWIKSPFLTNLNLLDVSNFFEEQYKEGSDRIRCWLFHAWTKQKDPIEEQGDDCIDLIYRFVTRFAEKQEKIKVIYDMIAKPLNVGDENQWDFWIEKVFIGDFLDYYWEYGSIRPLHEILRLWEDKRKPIEDQSFDCVDFIYKLISRQDDFWDHY